MEKNLLFFSFFLVIILSISAIACFPAPQQIVVKCEVNSSKLTEGTCLNHGCEILTNNPGLFPSYYGEKSFNVSKIKVNAQVFNDSIRFFSSEKENKSKYDAMLKLSNSICVENITSLNNLFSDEVYSWMQVRRGFFVDKDIIFEKYSKKKEHELFMQKQVYLLVCHYKDYERVGDWLVIKEKMRDYCHLSSGMSTCPNNSIYFFKFMKYLLSSFNPFAILYIAIITSFFILPSFLLIRSFRNMKNDKVHLFKLIFVTLLTLSLEIWLWFLFGFNSILIYGGVFFILFSYFLASLLIFFYRQFSGIVRSKR